MEHGADINCLDEDDRSPLLLACLLQIDPGNGFIYFQYNLMRNIKWVKSVKFGILLKYMAITTILCAISYILLAFDGP